VSISGDLDVEVDRGAAPLERLGNQTLFSAPSRVERSVRTVPWLGLLEFRVLDREEIFRSVSFLKIFIAMESVSSLSDLARRWISQRSDVEDREMCQSISSTLSDRKVESEV
jgi:hypothetical protein